MTLAECRDACDARIVSAAGRDPTQVEISDVVVSDLMSDVLVVDREDFLLVTSLTSEQVVRTAVLVEAVAILLTNGKAPQAEMQRVADEHGIPILSTARSTFDACRALGPCSFSDDD